MLIAIHRLYYYNTQCICVFISRSLIFFNSVVILALPPPTLSLLQVKATACEDSTSVVTWHSHNRIVFLIVL